MKDINCISLENNFTNQEPPMRKSIQMLTVVMLSFVFSSYACGQTIRTYSAQFTTNTIVADGIDSPGEWDGAETGGAAWNELRQPFGDADTSNNEFQILWDDDNLYLRWESDFNVWPNPVSYTHLTLPTKA